MSFRIRAACFCTLLVLAAVSLSIAAAEAADPKAPAASPPKSKPYEPDYPVPTPGCTEPTIDRDRSLVIHAPTPLDRFGFRRTIEAILASTGSSTATTPEAFLKTMIDSFGKADFSSGGKTFPVQKRTLEAQLSPAELLDATSPKGMKPIGLFNRFDLAPRDGSNCGEYRIVYARPKEGIKRFLLIFESRLPNPDPAAGLAGCKGIVKFWADLSAENDETKRLEALDKFYYGGLEGQGLGPVVKFANYGLPIGQIRSNLFLEFEWNLREHRTALTDTALPVLEPHPVNESPLVELFRLPGTLPATFNAADQAAFRAHFLDKPVCNLLNTELANPSATNADVLNLMGAGVDDRWFEFQSISQGTSDEVAVDTDPALVTAISTRIGQLSASAIADAQHLLNREGAMSCGGCHEFSNDKPLNKAGLKWPRSAGFVHINEDGTLSPALEEVFLRERARYLRRFVCNPTPETHENKCAGGPTRSAAAAVAGVQSLPSAEGLDATLSTAITSGRSAPLFQDVDAARKALVAVNRRAGAAAAGDRPTQATADAKAAAAALEAAVQRARAIEEAQPGAFVPVRRPH